MLHLAIQKINNENRNHIAFIENLLAAGADVQARNTVSMYYLKARQVHRSVLPANETPMVQRIALNTVVFPHIRNNAFNLRFDVFL